jgi:hypothetical protein
VSTWESIEASLAHAIEDGIEPNFQRWMRFAGIVPGEWLELQVLGLQTAYGDRTRFAHADSLETATRLLAAAERFNASGTYIIANRVNDAVATRREPGKWHDALKGQSTTDKDIAARRVLLIDIDAKRPSGTSASDDEVRATLPVAAAVHERLVATFGAGAVGIGHSGNGRQLPIALAETAESEAVAASVRAFLTALSLRYSTPTAQIDASVFDAKRLMPAFGTMKRKGAPGIAQRPHRRTAFVCADVVERVSVAQIDELTAWLRAETETTAPSVASSAKRPAPTMTPPPKAGSRPFERANATRIEDVAARLALVEEGAVRCPGCGNTSGVAFVGNGLKCLHNTCSGKGSPRNPGYRTPVDLVAEVRGISARDAVSYLAAEFGFEGFVASRTPAREPSAKTAPGNRPRILVDTEERRIADDAIAALVSGDAEIYQRGGLLVRVVRDDEKPRILTLQHPTLRELLAHHAEWVEERTKKNDVFEVSVHPPRWCVEAVHARGEWDGVRPLRAVVEFPVMRPDGTILQEPGYDPMTQVLFEPAIEFDSVPPSPSQEDAERARDTLLDVFQDFPFKAESNRSACIAALLTPFARYAFEGAVPCVLIDGNNSGAGKGLVANVIGTVVTGHELDVRAEVDNDDEFRKRIMSIARTGDPLVLIDNITKPLGGGALDAALTARRSWSDRGMGSFDEIRTPMVAMWMFTGNNIEFKRKDTKRRALHVRLESDDDNPENRRSFRHYPLIEYVRTQRRALVAAALTILRGYVVHGKTVALPMWGSFDEWSAIVRQAVVWCGLPDPYDSRAGLDDGDVETSGLVALIAGWEEITRDLGGKRAACTANEVLEALRQDDLARSLPEMRRHPATYPKLRLALAELISTNPGFLPNTQRLGALLRRFRGRVVSGRKLTCSVYAGTNKWTVEAVGATTPEIDATS